MSCPLELNTQEWMRRITRVMRISRIRAAPWPAASSPINDAMPRDVVPASPRARLARVFRVGLGLLRRGALGLLHDPLDRLLIAALDLGRGALVHLDDLVPG